MNLNGVYFNWKQDTFLNKAFGPDRRIGIIAQDLEIEFPELMHTDENGYKTVAYDRLGPILLQVMKEHQIKLQEAQRINSALTSRIAILKRQQTDIDREFAELIEDSLLAK